MKVKEIRDMDPGELKQKLLDAGTDLFNLRVQAKTGQLEKAMLIGQKKKDIARMKTVLKEPVYREKFAEFFDNTEKDK